MPRVKLFDEEMARKKAMELFWEKGYSATSLTDLTTHLGIGKGSFYAAFDSKQNLFEAAFNLYIATQQQQIKQLLTTEPNVKKGIRKLLESNLEELLADEKDKGCFVSNTCSEFSNIDKMLKTKLVENDAIVRQTLVDYLKEGEIEVKKAESMAAMLTTFLTGLSQQTKFNKDKERYLSSIDHLVALLN